VKNRSRNYLSLSTICFDPSQKIRMPSTKSKCETRQKFPIRIPLKEPFGVAALRAPLNPFATRRKRKGERGHPWQMTFLELKKGEADPLIKTVKATEYMQAITLGPQSVE